MKKFSINNDRIFSFANNTLLLIAFIMIAYPLIYVISASFSSTEAVAAGEVVLLPKDITLAGYQAVFQYPDFLSGYANTIFYAVVGTFINLVCTICAAYPLSRKDVKARKPLMLMFTFTMFFSGGMIPTYILVDQLNMMDTRWAMLLPAAVNIYNMIIMKTFFENTISTELLEAAKIDGCKDFRFIWSIVLPLSKAVIAVISLFYFVEHWNKFFDAFIYLTDRSKFPLQIILREILIMNEINLDSGTDIMAIARQQDVRELLKYSLIVVSSLPVIIIYPFVQKYFVRGVMIGSVKG